MANNIRIDLNHINMYYPSNIYNATTLKQEIFSRLKLEKPKPMLKDIHALKDFDLHIRPGERVGVIGRNGSGKSTLLRTIAGIYPVESGSVEVEGKVKALFDLILGFDLESTGRENILYRGLLLGATPREIAEKTEDIEELKTRRASILRCAGCKEDAGSSELQQRMAMIEGMLQKLDEQERKFSALSDQTIQKFADLQGQAAQVDADKMNAARQSVRAKYQDAAKKKLEETFGERYSLMRMMDSRKQIERLMKVKDNYEKKQERTKEKER